MNAGREHTFPDRGSMFGSSAMELSNSNKCILNLTAAQVKLDKECDLHSSDKRVSDQS